MAFTPANQDSSSGLRAGFRPLEVGGIPIQEKPQQNLFQKVGTQLGNFATGVAKGELSTLKGLGTIGKSIGENILDQTAGRVGSAILGKGFTVPEKTQNPITNIFQKGTPQEIKAREFLTPEGTAENIGFYGEQAAEFLIPAFKAAKAEKVVNVLSQGIKLPLAAAATRIGLKSAIQGVAAGAVKFVQTGGDTKAAVETGKTAALARGAFAVIGEGARALKIPERLYTTVFKNSRQDMLTELNADGLNVLKSSQPQKYKELLESGIIKETPGSLPTVNTTLAEEALDRGLRGSIKNMANEVVGTKYESELQLQQLVKGFQGTISIPEKQYVNVLKEIAEEYDNVGFGDISEEANRLAGVLQTSGGAVPAPEALSLRRLLDKLRFVGSYDKPVSKLSLSQANFKILSDELRPRINAIPGVQDVMDNYSFAIDALKTLAEEAKRRGNSQVVSLIDSIFLGGSIIDPIPALTLGTLRRMILSGAGSTNIGAGLSNPNLGVVGSAGLESASSALQSNTATPE